MNSLQTVDKLFKKGISTNMELLANLNHLFLAKGHILSEDCEDDDSGINGKWQLKILFHMMVIPDFTNLGSFWFILLGFNKLNPLNVGSQFRKVK